MSAAEQLLNALKDTLRGTGKPKRFVADVAAVLAAYGDLEQAVTSLRRRWEALHGSLTERASEAEHVASSTRTLLSRARDVRGAVTAAREAMEGVRLTALNVGLEGARQGDAGSAALVRWSDEVRARTVQAGESLDELVALLEQLDRDRERLRDHIHQLTREVVALAQLGRGDGIGAELVQTRLTELGAAIEQATGTDPELAPLLAAAAEHARGLASALSQLGARDGARLAIRSLQPLLEPLVTVLGELYGQGQEER